jgi:selenocysteine-specific elongation factor
VRVVATAGHVDHGKSTLVQALTGMDPDRFDEEKRRGLTIDLGFAWTELPSGASIAFVDVPGHVRFLKNMLAGVGAVDACLFVVAATEGWKPQSEEHLRILELLGIEHGAIALTKVAIVDDDHAELARLDVIDHVEGTFLEDAPIVAVDAPAGIGLDDVRAALDELLARAPAAADRERPRMWVDRVFAAAGAGTVVTGTLTGGSVMIGDELSITTPRGTKPVRVRGVQSLGTARDHLGPGNRAAINLVGVHHDEVARGDALVREEQWHFATTIDASLDVLGQLDHPVSRRGAYVAYLGSGEHPVRVRVLGREAVRPGERGAVRMHLPVALPLVPGDRYVLRESGRAETVGGGEILDVAPVTRAAHAAPDLSVERVIRERGWIDAEEFERLTGERRAPTVGHWIVDADAHNAALDRVGARVTDAGDLGLDVANIDERDRAVLDELVTNGDVVVDGGRAKQAGAGDPLAAHPYVAALEAEPFTPPSPTDAGVAADELRELVRRGLVVERDGVWFAPTALDAAARTVAELLAQHPDGVTVAQVREALGTSRKYAVPLLNHLDSTGVTRRRGDVRIGGPRLPQLPP